MSTEPNKVIYSMVGVGKYYDKKPVLKDIYLSYFYGAKIGVIGLNGSGKSSLLRIMAGVDKEINGEAVLSPGSDLTETQKHGLTALKALRPHVLHQCDHIMHFDLSDHVWSI